MRPTVPEREFDLYHEGFERVCELGRSTQGNKLSELIEKISEPLVVALDAPWGAGKSYFLKCWVGSHAIGEWLPEEDRPLTDEEKENYAQTACRTVYFDAFKDDFMDQPLIGLVAAVTERIGGSEADRTTWDKARCAATKLARPALNISLALATGGLMLAAGDAVDRGLTSAQKILEAENNEFWNRDESIRQAIEDFRVSLTEFAKDLKLVIVVDELGRRSRRLRALS